MKVCYIVENTGNEAPEYQWMVVRYPSRDGVQPVAESQGEAVAWYHQKSAAEKKRFALAFLR